jgi:hypothetical protein
VTEADWSNCTDPQLMLAFLRDRGASECRLRLFACACCRGIWDRLPDDRCRRALEVSERFADGAASTDELERASAQAEAVFTKVDDQEGEETAASAVVAACSVEDIGVFAQEAAAEAALVVASKSWRRAERRRQSGYLRDIVGNPFRSVVVSPDWLTSNVVSLALTIYDARSFELLPVLGDALLDAGCSNDELLDHCRGPNDHVRGCWLIDLLLTKE